MIRFLKRRLANYIDLRISEMLSMSALDVAIDIATGNQIEGDYLEFGVSTGNSFIRAYKRFEESLHFYGMKAPKRYFAFDSFEGLPNSKENFKPSQYQKGAYSCTEKRFLENLKNNNVDLSKVVVVKRWYDGLDEQVKREHKLAKASVIYIDCDLYESAKYALKFVNDLLVDGTIIVLDDYFRHKCSPNYGIRKAWEEFLSENKHITSTMVHRFRRVAFAINIL